MKSSVTGSAGPVGAAFAIREKTWRCPSCKNSNPPQRHACTRCRKKRPISSSTSKDLVWHEGVAAAAAGVDHHWREALDPSTKQLYYFNEVTRETRWDRPREMGEIVRNTGWFGRGRAGVQSKLDANNARYLSRPAAKQVEAAPRETSYLQGADMFNKWYGKYVGEHWTKDQNLEPAKHRCILEVHAGSTRADKEAGEGTYFCMYFAQGACPKGAKCRFYHRIPTYQDVGRLEKEAMKDVFGRERHATHREDMRGAGSFQTPSRTLYVGRLLRAEYGDEPKALRKSLEKHFSEWGEVESINLIWEKSIAFVRYRFRSHAEFALLAMANQALDKDEILDVRWAYEDPNPAAQEAMRRSNADALAAAFKAAGVTVENTSYALPLDYTASSKAASNAPAQITNGEELAATPDLKLGTSSSSSSQAEKQPRRHEDSDLFYPDTSAQYAPAPQTKKQRTN